VKKTAKKSTAKPKAKALSRAVKKTARKAAGKPKPAALSSKTAKKIKRIPAKPKARAPLRRTLPFWGRSASDYRPGLFIHGYLSKYPKASVSDIYKGLSEEIIRLNEKRAETEPPRPPPLRRPNYSSFARYFHWFKMLGLVRRTVKTEPAIYDFLQARVFYTLTPQGQAETEAWRDPIAKTHPEFR
jgi:hypothetical protein